jgi:hypothetical protein
VVDRGFGVVAPRRLVGERAVAGLGTCLDGVAVDVFVVVVFRAVVLPVGGLRAAAVRGLAVYAAYFLFRSVPAGDAESGDLLSPTESVSEWVRFRCGGSATASSASFGMFRCCVTGLGGVGGGGGFPYSYEERSDSIFGGGGDGPNYVALFFSSKR